MSNGNIHITVSGGNAVFSNIAVGDKNKLEDSSTSVPQIIQEFYKNIEELHESQGIAMVQIDSLKKEIQLLSQQKDKNKLAEKIKNLYENYSWAISPLKNLISTIML